ncbi:MAG: hypothetical protein ACRCX8_00675 [Sarcina sp.]
MFKKLFGGFKRKEEQKDKRVEILAPTYKRIQGERLLIEPSIETIKMFRKHCRFYTNSDIMILKDRVRGLKTNLLPHLEYEPTIVLVKDFIKLTEEKIANAEKIRNPMFSMITNWQMDRRTAFKTYSEHPEFNANELLKFVNEELDLVRCHIAEYANVDPRVKKMLCSYRFELIMVKDMLRDLNNKEMM